MLCRWDEQAFETSAKIWRAANIGLRVGVFAIECEDCCFMREFAERRLWICGIEGDGLEFSLHDFSLTYAPASVMPSMRNVGAATELRKRRSLPMAEIFCSISARFPAMVTSSTAWVSSPFSIHRPVAPRE